jgi:hypothetical protein
VVDLSHHRGQRLGVRYGPVGNPSVVAGEPLADRFEIRLSLGLLQFQIAHHGVSSNQISCRGLLLGAQAGQLGMLWQGTAPVQQLS